MDLKISIGIQDATKPYFKPRLDEQTTDFCLACPFEKHICVGPAWIAAKFDLPRIAMCTLFNRRLTWYKTEPPLRCGDCWKASDEKCSLKINIAGMRANEYGDFDCDLE